MTIWHRTTATRHNSQGQPGEPVSLEICEYGDDNRVHFIIRSTDDRKSIAWFSVGVQELQTFMAQVEGG